MQNQLAALKPKSPAVQHCISVLLGGITVGTMCFLYDRKHYDNLHTLVLGKDACNALINGDTNFVRFTSDKFEHAFLITLEQ